MGLGDRRNPALQFEPDDNGEIPQAPRPFRHCGKNLPQSGMDLPIVLPSFFVNSRFVQIFTMARILFYANQTGASAWCFRPLALGGDGFGERMGGMFLPFWR